MKPFLRLVAEDIQRRFGKDLSDVAVVFNNKRPVTYLRKHLSEVYGQAIWSPQFFTIQEFFNQSTNKSDVSALTQFFYLYELHNELLKEEGLEPEELEEFYPIAEIILGDFGQLDYELVRIDHIYMELYDSTKMELEFQYLDKEQQEFIRQFWQSFSIGVHTGVQQRFLKLWKRMPTLYQRFKEKLSAENQTNFPTVYRELAEGKAFNSDFIRKYKKVLFVGFNALNTVETKLFKQWQDEDIALFYFDVDAYYLEDKVQEAGLFVRRNIQDNNLINALGEAPNVIEDRTDDVHLYSASGSVSETKLLYEIVKNQEEGKSAAILLADESLLVSLLQSLPAIKTNITTGFPLLQSPIYALIDLWLEVQQEITFKNRNKLPYQTVETFITHPLTKMDKKEKLMLQMEVIDKQLFEIDLDSIGITSSLFPNFFTPIPKDQLIPELLKMLEKLLIKSEESSDLKIDSLLIFEARKILLQLQVGLKKVGPLNVLFQGGLIRKALNSVSAAIEGDPLQGVQIMGLLESRCLNFDKIYILGANEGILPKTSSSATFLPNNLRKAYRLPILENQDALSAYLFYRHFQYSSDIHLFYNHTITQGSTGEESRFIKQLEFESKFNIKKHIQNQPVEFPPVGDELIIQKDSAVWQALYDKYIRRKSKISASALTTYLQSPLQFFMKYVADIKEPPSVSQEFEINKLGTVIHNVMEHILLPYKGVDTFVSTKELIEKLPTVESLVVQEVGVQYHQQFTKIEELNSLQRLMHMIASEYVKMYLQYDIDTYKAFKIVELENDEDYIIDFPITVNGETEIVKLYGIIDRVDEVVMQDGDVQTRIVDYKTGSDQVVFRKQKRKNEEDEIAENLFAVAEKDLGINKALVQTLFYAYVFEQKTQLKNLVPHLYVARKMREDGTLFKDHHRKLELEGDFLIEQKAEFVSFLRKTLEELFNPEVGFRHYADTKIYDSDPYQLFYRSAKQNRISD